MTTETRRHIDAARQVLVGVVPNPTSQIDQITNALIYKFMDDMDQSAIKQGGDPSFFVGDLEKYSWTRLMDARMGHQERMNIYSEALIKFSQSKQLPPLFREIFKSAFLPYRSPEVLGLFLKEIDFFDYSHPEELGNAYEYLLSIMSSQGDAGQFRTPRHIIDFMVEVVDPTVDDKVLDPACGTGGFLVSAYNHILKQHAEKPLTPDQRKNIMGNFEGYDIDPSMVRIAQVNMYLHSFKNPKIVQYDTLSMEERWNEKFSVMLANPPFMSPKGGVKTHSKFSVQSTRSEVLFVDYIMNHLKPHGRAAIIVPEGIIFQSGASHKQLRKNLVEDGLFAVVSLPSGVFQPYSGVKTSILLFDNEVAKKSKDILFVKIENDGFDLGATKRPINKNDLPKALEILKAWQKGTELESHFDGLLTEDGNNLATESSSRILLEQQIAHAVSREVVAESGDYNLSGDRYRVATDYSNSKWPMVELGEVCDLESGSRDKGGAIDNGVYSIGGEQISEDNAIRFEKMKYITETHFSQMRRGVLSKGDVLMVKDGATTGKMGYWDFDYRAAVNEHVFIFRAKERILPKYLYGVLISDSFQYELKPYIKGIIGGISLEIKKITIPLPPLEVQEQIVAELDGYQNIIAGAKQISTNWKPVIEIDPEWEKVKLGEVLETSSGGTPLKSKSEYYNGGTIPWITSGEVSQGLILEATQFITESGLKGSSAKKFPVDTVLVAMYGATVGQVGILGIEATTNQAVCGLFPNPKYAPKFLYYFLLQQKEDFIRLSAGGAQPNISQNIIRNLEIPDISIETQKQIVERIESERTLVEGNKKLIEIYEQKTKDILAKLWEE